MHIEYDIEVKNIEDFNDFTNDYFEDYFEVYDRPPDGVDINNFSESEIEEGAIEITPKQARILFRLEKHEIPNEFRTAQTFTPWYANEDIIEKNRGNGCEIGVSIELKLESLEKIDSGFIGHYLVNSTTETG